MITILGTSHVSQESIDKIRKHLKNKDCVCVELDPIRYHSLLHKETKMPPGVFPKILHIVQQKIGRSTGILPGEEMLTAVQEARARSVPAYLIDQDIRMTLTGIKKVPFFEKMSILVPLLVAPGRIDASRVPSQRIISTALREMRKRAPTMHSVLVTERNAYMASWIDRIAPKYRNVLVVVGAAHSKGLEKILKAEGHKVRTVQP